jgi:hypothetical protein
LPEVADGEDPGPSRPLPLADGERAFVLLLAVVNGVSLLFDALDSWRWFRGERAVPGHCQEVP